ncbi:MAG TPA: alpha/beta-type small acid-soluble spore protein [Firmicutes bacterium]|nr:alpha/beta-type small acid-soluble spore protein [Bacillota bacterium]HHY97664.1 alpha/beta-type small acid-soluble spore protein [Bacillota bacterium]
MPRRNRSTVVPQARGALDNLKYEIANEINFPTNLIQGDYWGNISSAQCGAVGGHMVRRMIEAAERTLAEQVASGVRTAFRATLGQAGQPGYISPSGVAGTTQPGVNPPGQVSPGMTQ